jgi:hypothetical protein
MKKDSSEMLNTLKEYLLSEKEKAINYIISIIQEQESYIELQEIPYHKIPYRMNTCHEDSYAYHFLSCRLSNEDPFEKDLPKCMSLLYDISFDTDLYSSVSKEEYKNIGVNDGKIIIIESLLSLMGLEKEAQEISKAIFTS